MNITQHKDKYDATHLEWREKAKAIQDEIDSLPYRCYYGDKAQRRHDERQLRRQLKAVHEEYSEKIAALKQEWNMYMSEPIEEPRPKKSWGEIRKMLDSL